MRPAALALAAVAVLGTACAQGPCQELGNRLCTCVPFGTTRDACKTQVQNQLKSTSPSSADERFCDGRLALCHEPAGTDFCQWITTDEGKEACGLAYVPVLPESGNTTPTLPSGNTSPTVSGNTTP